MKILILSFITLMLVSCSTSKVQKNSELEEFDESKFLGKWYEIGRIDYFFQKNIINSIAEYSLNENGTIKVINKGYNIKKDKEVTAEGHAVIKGKGRLKVYFNPFFGGDYNVLYVDNDYQYALIGGGKPRYLWILSREKSLNNEIYDKLVQIAKEKGYETDKFKKY
ncbi:MAG: lipocalin family protein [Sebaldella sp.]|nr:lipocalin family protein [Sebaldella sp.]